jgi:golgi to ER traffic protein 4
VETNSFPISEKNYFLARFHFMHSPDGRNCAKMLVELHVARGFSNEIDLFITQAVLQWDFIFLDVEISTNDYIFRYLCLQNKNAAILAFTSYTANHPNIMKKNPPFLMPMLNFLWFLLQAIERYFLLFFVVSLRNTYKSIWIQWKTSHF